jgi:hypothetical protein
MKKKLNEIKINITIILNYFRKNEYYYNCIVLISLVVRSLVFANSTQAIPNTTQIVPHIKSQQTI